MSRTKRLTALLLMAFLASQTFACGDTGTPDETTDNSGTTTEAETTDPLLPTETADFGEREFTVITTTVLQYVYSDEQNGSPVNDAMYERNARVGDRFNVTFSEITATKEELSKLIRTAVTAGDDVYDAAFCPVDNISALMSDGILTDLLKVSSLNLSEAWWDNDVIEAGTINDKCYLASSDITFFPFEATWILYFN